MRAFNGFPARMQFTPIPNLFFSSLVPQIEDIAELKVTLYIFEIFYVKKGYPRFVTCNELLGNAGLVASLKGTDKPEESLRRALEMAVGRGTILHLTLDREGKPEDVYFLNTDEGRKTVSRIQRGELVLSGFKAGQPAVETEEMPDIFTLYEQNIGMLNPMIAEELRDAEKTYPEAWLRDAIKEAVSLNKRNWRYILRILERWTAEGRDDGTYRGDFKKKTDPDRYVKGKYGHVVRR